MIKFVDYYKQYLAHKDEIDFAMQMCIKKGAFILQSEVEEFERKLAKYVGTKYAVGLNSGTDALFLSLKLAGIKAGDEVITVGHTFHATVEAIYWNGAKPVLVDVGEDGLMDVSKIEEAITERTKAIIPVHLMGDVCDMDKIMEIAERYRLIVVEDACQALGGEWNDKKAGSFGLAGCFSFYPAKILGAMGDAGAICTNDEALAKELKDMRCHYKYNPGKYGFNSRLDNIQAAILSEKIEFLDLMLDYRQVIADIYNTELKGVGDIVLPTKRIGRVYQDYIIRTDRRDDLYNFLKENGIETMKNDYHFPDELPKPEGTINLEKRTLRLPCNDVLTDGEALEVCNKIKEFYG